MAESLQDKTPSSNAPQCNWGDYNEALSGSKNHYESGLKFITGLIEENPEEPLNHLRRAKLLQRFGYTEAYDDYAKENQIKPNVEAYRGMGQICIYSGIERRNFPLALQHYTKAIKLDSKAPWLHLGRAKAWDELGFADEALADASVEIELFPSMEEAYYTRGTIYQKMGRLPEALKDFQKSRTLDGHFMTASIKAIGAIEQKQAELANPGIFTRVYNAIFSSSETAPNTQKYENNRIPEEALELLIRQAYAKNPNRSTKARAAQSFAPQNQRQQ